jgi:hypothetical protein
LAMLPRKGEAEPFAQERSAAQRQRVAQDLWHTKKQNKRSETRRPLSYKKIRHLPLFEKKKCGQKAFKSVYA